MDDRLSSADRFLSKILLNGGSGDPNELKEMTKVCAHPSPYGLPLWCPPSLPSEPPALWRT